MMILLDRIGKWWKMGKHHKRREIQNRGGKRLHVASTNTCYLSPSEAQEAR